MSTFVLSKYRFFNTNEKRLIYAFLNQIFFLVATPVFEKFGWKFWEWTALQKVHGLWPQTDQRLKVEGPKGKVKWTVGLNNGIPLAGLLNILRNHGSYSDSKSHPHLE